MRLSDIDYHLPEELIAQSPVEPRDSARLLVDTGGEPRDAAVSDLDSLLRDGDLLVVNDTRVLPVRLSLHRASGGAAEVFLLESCDDSGAAWEAMVRPARKLREGEVLQHDGVPAVRIGPRTAAGDTFEVELLGDDPSGLPMRIGSVPLPPYIRDPLADPERYQTVYAREPRSAAAPTAGLHFTPALLERLSLCGVATANVELVVGIDTFKPVTEDDPTRHRIHTERYCVPESTVAAVRDARRVVAVGTTAARALESVAATGKREGRTSLFISRGHEWRSVDLLMTNFHMPRTTLLLMIDSFVGPRWRDLYAHAVRERYRFLSFGDAMLLDRHATGSPRV
ncbi:MAG: tRNA preQ1(34) S-adenosylmethionine ribosyltransferase-isomerase QueA [Ilumatobacteraceae bacterium]